MNLYVGSPLHNDSFCGVKQIISYEGGITEMLYAGTPFVYGLFMWRGHHIMIDYVGWPPRENLGSGTFEFLDFLNFHVSVF